MNSTVDVKIRISQRFVKSIHSCVSVMNFHIISTKKFPCNNSRLNYDPTYASVTESRFDGSFRENNGLAGSRAITENIRGRIETLKVFNMHMIQCNLVFTRLNFAVGNFFPCQPCQMCTWERYKTVIKAIINEDIKQINLPKLWPMIERSFKSMRRFDAKKSMNFAITSATLFNLYLTATLEKNPLINLK